MTKVLFNSQWIDVEEIDRATMSWGADYCIFKDADGRYYATLADGMAEVIDFMTFEQRLGEVTDYDARKELSEVENAIGKSSSAVKKKAVK